jgi:hypothetical protein
MSVLTGFYVGFFAVDRPNLRQVFENNSRLCISLRIEVSIFVLSPEIEDRNEVEVATWRTTEIPYHLNMIRNLFYIGRATRVSKPVYFLTVHCQISNDFFLLVHTAQK